MFSPLWHPYDTNTHHNTVYNTHCNIQQHPPWPWLATMNPQQHILTLAMHLDPPAMCFHPPSRCFHPQTQVSTTYDPPAVHFDPDWHPRHMFWPPTTPQPTFQPRLAPQAPKCTYDCSYMCFSFCFFFLASETHVRAIIHMFLVFLFIYYSFLPSKRVYDCSYTCFLCFYSFIIYFYPQNMCMSNHTCISLWIHVCK